MPPGHDAAPVGATQVGRLKETTPMKIEIWIEFASTYSYLTIMRAEKVLSQEGIDFAWRPFLLGPIFRAKGWETSPFVLDPVKGAYMWRDVARRAERLGLPFMRPSIFPANGLNAARIMTAALAEPWCGAFACNVFTAQFERGEDISTELVLAAALEACGTDPSVWLACAQDDTNKLALRTRTERAQDLGIFGAPCFTVGEELFWGDDRMEDAVDWARGTKGA